MYFRMVLDGESDRFAARLHRDGDVRRMEEQIHGWNHSASAKAGLRAVSEADVHFHRVVAEASGNALLGLCARAVHDAVVDVIEKTIVVAADTTHG